MDLRQFLSVSGLSPTRTESRKLKVRVAGYSTSDPSSSIECAKSGNSASIKPSSSTPSSFGS